MATEIELAALATRTTTTITEAKVQDREGDTLATGTPVDLVDNRALSLELVASGDDAYPYAILEAEIETSEDGLAWRDLAKFDRFKGEGGAVVRQRISCIADRYVRASWRIAKGYHPTKGAVRFSIVGRGVGSAT